MLSAARSATRAAALAVMVMAITTPAPAREAQPLVADPALEARVMQVADELRCMVCQNETLAASQAELARDLRDRIRDQLVQGQTPRQVTEFMVARYGEFVLYRPPLRAGTVLLWAGPFALLALALVWGVARVRRSPATDTGLTADEQRRVQQLLDRSDTP